MQETSPGPALEQYKTMAELLGTRIVHAERADLVDTVAEVAGRISVGVTNDLLKVLPELQTLVSGRDRWPAVLVSRALYAVASNGSVVLGESEHADRVPALLTLRHIVLLPASAVVPSLRQLVPLIRASAHHPCGQYVTLVAGPSRTADIEKILTIGAHGPRELMVIVVRGWSPANA